MFRKMLRSLLVPPMPADDPSPLKRELTVLVIFRLITATVFVGSTYFYGSGGRGEASPYLLGLAIISTYVLSAFHLLAIKFNERYTFQVAAQVVGDLLFWTFCVYTTGGLTSPFAFIYVLPIIHAAVFLRVRGGIVAALLSSILLLMLLWFETNEVFLPQLHWTSSYHSIQDSKALYRLFLMGSLFMLAGVVVGNFSSRFYSHRQTILTQRISLDLQKTINRSLVSGLRSGFLLTDNHGTVMLVNQALRQMTGWPDDVWNSAPFHRVWPELASLAGLVDGNQEERNERLEFRFMRDDGAELWFAAGFNDLLDPHGVKMGSMILIDDITKRKKLETELMRSQQLAAVGQLAAGIAHEIRNPLGAISGSVQMLAGDESLGDDDKMLIDIIHHESDRLNLLVKDFLDFARPSRLTPSKVNLYAVLSEIRLLIRRENPDIRIFLECLVDDPVVQGDADKLRQVFWNLMKNAKEALLSRDQDGESGSIYLCIHSREESRYLEVLVVDEGQGMNEETLNQVFVPFFTTKQEGTGLGMATAYRILQSHGGGIVAESAPGEGTHFRVRLLKQLSRTSPLVVNSLPSVEISNRDQES